MKSYKIITIITITLLILIITIASFCGIYKLKDYRVKDVVPEYSLGMEFSDSRVVNFEVDNTIESTTIYDEEGNEIKEENDEIEYTEENGYTVVENKVNPEDKLTKENFKRAKTILVNRLVELGVEQYTIKQDDNGNIQIEMTENDNAGTIISDLAQKGTFELVDTETNEVLLDNSNIKSSNVVYGQTDTGTTVYLQIKFNKEGKQKLQEISEIYVENTVQTTNEEGETEETTETKEVSIMLDGETYKTTYFGETITDGMLNIAIGASQDSSTLQEYATTATELAIILNNGVLPITYNVTNYTLNNSTNLSKTKVAIYVIVAILAIISIFVIVKLKSKGILAVLLQIGYISLLLLILRYTNIKITTEGIVGIVITILINYMYIYKVFKNSELNFVKETTAKFGLKLIPIYIIAIVFTFSSIANIASLGMTLVWGIMMMYLYNLTLTQITIKTLEDK